MSKQHSSQRRKAILEQVEVSGFVSIVELAVALQVSEMTIRRDLDFMDEEGLLKRSHGGAVKTQPPVLRRFDEVEPDFGTRRETEKDKKIAIAHAALKYVKPMDFIALDIGTTTYQIAKLIKSMNLTLFTSSIKIAEYLSKDRARVYVPSGEVRGVEPSIVGTKTLSEISQLHFDCFFLGVSSVNESTLYDYSLEDSEIKKQLIKQSKKVIAVVDSTKFDRTSVASICSLSEIDVLITDQSPTSKIFNIINNFQLELVIAEGK